MGSQGKSLQHALDVVIPLRSLLALLCATDRIGHQEDRDRAVRVLFSERHRQSQAVIAALTAVRRIVQDKTMFIETPFVDSFAKHAATFLELVLVYLASCEALFKDVERRAAWGG